MTAKFGKCFIEVDGKLTNISDLPREQYLEFMKLMEEVHRIWWLMDWQQLEKQQRLAKRIVES